MADIGAISIWPVGVTPAASATQAGAGWALPVPRNNVGRRIANWVATTAEAVRATFRYTERPKPNYYHPSRESFIEDAAMSRAMDRL